MAVSGHGALSRSCPQRPKPPLKVAVSACLIGEAVRYDGTDAAAQLPWAALRNLFSFVGICPEVGIGMGTPRPPMRLVEGGNGPRAVLAADPSADFTDALGAFAQAQTPVLDQVFGYIFMERSPSCGLASVKVRRTVASAPLRTDGRGVYARQIVRRHPHLPVEESGRLADPSLRESFFNRVAAYAHWRTLLAAGLQPAHLIDFHARHKYLLMAHSVPHYQRCGVLLSDLRGDWAGIGAQYFGCLMDGLARPATAAGHANALAHMQGYLKRRLDRGETAALAESIDRCRTGEQPVAEVRAALWRLLRRHGVSYLLRQAYFDLVLANSPGENWGFCGCKCVLSDPMSDAAARSMGKDSLTVRLSVKLTEALITLAATVEGFAATQTIADSVSFRLNLVLDELVTNSISYSLPDVAAPWLRLRLGRGPDSLMAQLEDNGVAFNPFSQAPIPDTTLAVQDRPVGGLGVHLVKQFADAFDYERDEGVNRITLWLKLEEDQSEQ